MKKLILLLALCTSLSAGAQITIDSSDFFSVGDTFTMAIGKNPQVIDVTGGMNKTWDFSSLTVDFLSGAKARAIDANTYPGDTLFPNSDMKMTSASYGESYLRKSADSMTLDGIGNLELIQGVSFDYNITPDLKIIDFPMNYNDNYITTTALDTVIDTTVITFDSIRISVQIAQDVSVEGYGQLKTVQGTYDVLKVYSMEAQGFSVYGHIPVIGWSTTPFITDYDTVHNYRWFGKGNGYQLAEASSLTKDGVPYLASFLVTDSLLAFISDSVRPACNGDNNGSATVKAVGGSGTYSYRWSNNASASTAHNLGAGTYTVTVTDVGSSKTATTQITLSDPDTLSIYLISKKDEGPAPNTGEIEIGVLGGTEPYTYAWDNSNSTAKIASDLPGGIQQVTVTDNNSCTKDTSIEIGSTVGLPQTIAILDKLFPNPTSGKVQYLSSPSNPIEAVRVTNIMGEVILDQSTEYKYFVEVDLSHLESGIYFVHIDALEDRMYKVLKE